MAFRNLPCSVSSVFVVKCYQQTELVALLQTDLIIFLIATQHDVKYYYVTEKYVTDLSIVLHFVLVDISIYN